MPDRRHLMFLLDENAHTELARLRHAWDPVMAAGVPPHVTLAYPEEATDERLLLERAATVAGSSGAFTLTLGSIVADDEGRGGVFVAVGDPSGSWSRLRSRLLCPPLSRLDVSPHATIVHPRTSDRGTEAWRDLSGGRLRDAAIVREMFFTETTSNSRLRVLERFTLGSSLQCCCAGLLLIEADRCLLARRSANRESYPDESYPDVWDLPGGHVESTESLRGAAVREAREELGIELDPSALAHLETRSIGAYELTVFVARRWRGSISNLAPAEHAELRWVRLQELEALDVADPSLRLLAARALETA